MICSAAAAGVMPAAVVAQTEPATAPNQPVPGALELSKLVWSTMAAIEHANQSGNYSVLRDIAAPSFQINNDPTRLATVFAGIRASGVDLANTLLLGATYTSPARMVGPGIMRLEGYFGLRPTAVAFDFHYQWVEGRWRLLGVSVGPRPIATQQPEGTSPGR